MRDGENDSCKKIKKKKHEFHKTHEDGEKN